MKGISRLHRLCELFFAGELQVVLPLTLLTPLRSSSSSYSPEEAAASNASFPTSLPAAPA